MNLPARETDAEFADLMCADPQWLREEFDALIAAAFGHPPAAPPPAPPAAPRRGPWRPPDDGQGRDRLPADRTTSSREHGDCRQRAPPA